MALPPWRRVVSPHENIKNGQIKQNDFAASLADVLDQDGNPDYYDPVRFFNRTYLTFGLQQLAGEVVGRLTGQGDGDAVMQIQTPFGGGKTHTLICLYHLVKNGNVCFQHENLTGYWLERGWAVPPDVPVAAFDGNHVGVGPVEIESGVTIQTMWGHIAWQLAGKEGYQLMASDDQDRVSPGGHTIDKLFKLSGGGLIILDEVVNYIEKSAAVEVKETTLRAQTLTFLQSLTVRAGSHDKVVVAATLPKSHLELHGGASSDALDRLQKIFGRVQKVREPVEGDEVHEIIRRRLFENIGKKAQRDKVVQEYMNDFKERTQIPDDVKDHTYAVRFAQSYPFHPFLIDILNRYVGSNNKFQRTRGALRLLALIVADLHKKKHKGLLIHPGDIDLENEEIRSELLELVDREFRSPLEADIIGKGANCSEIDKQSKTLSDWNIAKGLGTTAFLYTCEAGNQSKGASFAELNLAAARPGIDFGTIPGVIHQMKESLHFLNTEGGRYRFSTTPNLNRILIDAKSGVEEELVLERMESELRGLLTTGYFSGYIWPESPSDIPDSPSNKLVLLSPSCTHDGRESSEAVLFAKDILQSSGSSRRTRRNTLVFVFPDNNESVTLKDRIRALIATEIVEDNHTRYTLSPEQTHQLSLERTNLKKGVRQQLLRTFRHIAWGDSIGDTLTVFDMGQPGVSSDQSLTDIAVRFLKEKQKYLEQLASLLIVHPTKLKVWPEDEPVLRLHNFQDYFKNFTHLPILRDADVLKQSIVDGIRTGRFALAEGTNAEDAKVLYYKEDVPTSSVDLGDTYLLLRSNLAEEKLEADKEPSLQTPPSDGNGATISTPPKVTQPSPVIPVGETLPTGPLPTPPPPTKAKTHHVQLDVDVRYIDFHTFYTGVINALGRNADNITIRVQIEAESQAGFGSTLIEDTVKETLYQLYQTDEALKTK